MMRDKVWYFAYGSNMNPERMKEERGVKYYFKKHAKLQGFRLEFNKMAKRNPKEGFANIVEDEKGAVEGVLYEIKKSDLGALDRYEVGYDRIKLKVQIEDGSFKEAEVYKAQPVYVKKKLKPSRSYMKHLLSSKGIVSASYFNSFKKTETLD